MNSFIFFIQENKIFCFIELCINLSGKFISYTQKCSPMKIIVSYQKRKCNKLQHQKGEQIKVPSNEKKYVTHGLISFFHKKRKSF